MKTKYIYSLCIMLSMALGLSSCLKGEDETDYSQYDDMAIITFTLTSVNRYIHKTSSSNTDSIVIQKLTNFPVFTIDQYGQAIYNREPLPADCDLKHVLATITSKNNGQIVMKSLMSDSLFYYSSTDSIDFSQPREFRVYALNGEGYRTYTVTLNIEDADTDDIEWESVENADDAPKALYQDIVLQRNVLDGDEGDTFRLSKDGGDTWTYELLGEGEDASQLPTSGIAWVSFPYSASKNADYELMVGTCDDNSGDCTVWRKIIDKDATTSAKWVNIPIEDSNNYTLPKMDPISLAWFHGSLYAFGNNGKIYLTRDGGIMWKVTDDLPLPEGLESNRIKAATDEDGRLYLRDLDNEQLWRTK